jgi:hypothetical protein
MAKIFFTILLTVAAFFTQAQNVGIGTTLPKARLHITDSAVLFTGPTTLPSIAGLPPISGGGTRLMWYPNKAAFRVGSAGSALTTVWNESNIGNYSFGAGYGGLAKGIYAATIGYSNEANGLASLAAGWDNSATGNYSTAIGYGLLSNSRNGFVIGQYNDTVGNHNSISWVEADPLFVVGNGKVVINAAGVGVLERSNAFEVQKNGNATIGKRLFVNENLKVLGNTDIDGRVILNGDLFVHGKASFIGAYTNVSGYLNVDTINTIKAINANLVSGPMPIMNLVPLGVVKFYVTYNRNGIDQCLRSHTNLAGNFISSSIGFCEDPFGQVSKVGISLMFTTAQAALYNDIIAAPNIDYSGMGIILGPTGAELTGCGGRVLYDANNKPVGFYAGFDTEDIPTTGVYNVSGTGMFYGIK